MDSSVLYLWLADAVLVIHAAVTVFVVAGLALVIVGGLQQWDWVRNRGFRYAHLLAIAIVVFQSWLGVRCPLTTLEMWLRARAGEPGYSGSFIQHWLHELLYYEAPSWVFVLAYTLFAGLVLLTWWWLPPRKRNAR